MTGTNISTLPIFKIDLSYHPFIKYDIFEVTENSPPICTTIGIVAKYYYHHNMFYISQSTKNIPRNRAFPAGNITNV